MDSSWHCQDRGGIRLRDPLAVTLAALTFASALAAPSHAAAQGPPSPTPAATASDEEDEDGPEAGTARAAASDTRFGHILIAPRVDLSVPVGSLAAGTTASDFTGSGLGIGGMVGFGISRYVVLEATGGASLLPGPASLSGATHCGQCNGRMFDVGAGFSYHLAQGVAIDPWVSFGMGFRIATFNTITDPVTGKLITDPMTGNAITQPERQTFRGFDFARIALGADFYPLAFLGLGPYLEADIGTRTGGSVGAPPLPSALSADAQTGPAFYAFFHFGVRLALDPLRSGSARPRPAALGRRSGGGPGI